MEMEGANLACKTAFVHRPCDGRSYLALAQDLLYQGVVFQKLPGLHDPHNSGLEIHLPVLLHGMVSGFYLLWSFLLDCASYAELCPLVIVPEEIVQRVTVMTTGTYLRLREMTELDPRLSVLISSSLASSSDWTYLRIRLCMKSLVLVT